MTSDNYQRYQKIIRWPDLRVVREPEDSQKWHINERNLSCPGAAGISGITGESGIFKVWIEKSLEKGKLYLLDHNGNEITPDGICPACAARVMRLVRWRHSDEGNLETEQQESRDESEERDFRAKGLLE